MNDTALASAALKAAPAEPIIAPYPEAFVAEIFGVDLSRPLDPSSIAAIERAFRDHPVLIFRRQALEPAALMRFGAYFGTLTPHAQLKYRVPDYPACSYVTNREPDGSVDEYGQSKRAVDFHSDGSFKPVPDAITILHGIEVPSVGGATIFADMYAAYDALPADLKKRLDGVKALHRVHRGIRGSRGPSQRATGVDEHPGSRHPIVRTHPDTGRRSLYVNALHTERVDGLGDDDSRDLLDAIYAHGSQPAFQYVHRWQKGDVVMWDQRCTWHRAGGGAPRDEPRILLRTMITTGPAPA